jgi:acyl-CoA reductase-like NAD-dependent aldehyde dehydrogenase
MSEDEIAQIVLESHLAQKKWKTYSLEERVGILQKCYDHFQAYLDEIALLIAREM